MVLAKIEKIRNCEFVKKIFQFQSSACYIGIIGTLVTIAHIFGLELPVYYIMTVIGVFTILFNPDSKPFLPILFYLIFAISTQHSPSYKSDFLTRPEILGQLIFVGGSLSISAVVRIFMTGEIKKLNLRNCVFVSFLILAGCLAINGIFSKDYTLLNLVWSLEFSASLVISYIYFRATLKWDKDCMDYLAKVFLIAGLVIFFQMVHLYLFNAEFRLSGEKGDIHLGWALSNHIGATLFVTMPFGLYLMNRSEKPWYYFLLTVAIMVALVLTLSRATLLFAAPVFVAGIIFSCFTGRNKKQIFILSLAMLAAAIIVFFCFYKKIIELLAFYLEKGFDDNGRYEVWQTGFNNFVANPIFGAGVRYGYKTIFFSFYFMHNTVLQMLSMGGFTAFLPYVWHRIQTVKIFIKKPSIERIFLAAAFFGLMAICLLDNAILYPYTEFYYSVMLVFAELEGNAKRTALPRARRPVPYKCLW